MVTINQQIANSDDRLKTKLENTFRPELMGIFNRMRKEYARRYIINYEILNTTTYLSDFQQALRKHYTRVNEAFLGRVLKSQTKQEKKQEIDDEEVVLNRAELLLLNWRNQRAIEQSLIINDTNQDQINQATTKAIDEADDPSNRGEVVAISSSILARWFKTRASTISEFETVNPAETTKNFEARELSTEPLKDDKTWITVGDARVRDSHKAANNQTVNIDSSFSVGTSELKYPADGSLGASIEELMNCRCSAVYNINSRFGN